MSDLEESQRVTIERLQKEIEEWKKKYSDQIKTDQEWERYIKKSREEGEEQSKQKVISWTLGLLWALLVIYELGY
jgi:tRNA U34 5-carboxymethylaminomethyl modifying enzyme MnmG/GidA